MAPHRIGIKTKMSIIWMETELCQMDINRSIITALFGYSFFELLQIREIGRFTLSNVIANTFDNSYAPNIAKLVSVLYKHTHIDSVFFLLTKK